MARPSALVLSVLAALAALASLPLAAGEPGPPSGSTPLEKPGAAAEAEAESEEGGLGITAELTLQSAYGWRGRNSFAEDDSLDQNGLLGGTLQWKVPGTGLWAYYWTAWQTNGRNRRDLIDEGTGAEQGVFAGYDHDLSDALSLSAYAGLYFFPWAETKTLTYLDAGVEGTLSTILDLGLFVGYFRGLPRELLDDRYGYFRAKAGKELALLKSLEFKAFAAFGVKWFERALVNTENVFDAELCLECKWSLVAGLYATPGVHFAWTNLKDLAFRDEFFVWAGLAVGLEI